MSVKKYNIMAYAIGATLQTLFSVKVISIRRGAIE